LQKGYPPGEVKSFCQLGRAGETTADPDSKKSFASFFSKKKRLFASLIRFQRRQVADRRQAR
jgi:hypothetical protein